MSDQANDMPQQAGAGVKRCVSDADIIDIIDKMECSDDAQVVLAVFSDYMRSFGFDTVALAHLVNPALVKSMESDWFNHSSWPDAWYQSWVDERFILHDPIARYALRSSRPFTWSQAYEYGTKFGKLILDKSRDFGFSEGFAVPIHSMDGPPGIVSLGGKNVDLAPRALACIELAARHCYARLERLHHSFPTELPPTLTRRETEALHYAAAGKTNWEIGKILSIAEDTVRQHLTSAARKLNCSNRTHAVSVAIQKNLIFP